MYQALGAPEQQNFTQPAMSAENSNAISPARKRPFSAYLCPESRHYGGYSFGPAKEYGVWRDATRRF